MLYNQLKEVLEIDARIVAMHRELTDLYQKRADYVSGSTSVLEAKTGSTAITPAYEDRAKAKHAQLITAWNRHDIKIPAYKSLSKKLIKACETLDQVILARPDLLDMLDIVLVPPTK